jgi:hypothetical protein
MDNPEFNTVKMPTGQKSMDFEDMTDNDEEDDEFYQNQDEVLQNVGIEKRDKFINAMQPFLEWLKS